jgi:hypothetical protein
VTVAVPVENRAALPEGAAAALRPALAAQTTMERALNWFRTQAPPLAPEDLVAQDEFSYDLLVPLGRGLYLSYDTN